MTVGLKFPQGPAVIAVFVSPLLEIALVLVRLNHVARIVVNANESVMRASEKSALGSWLTCVSCKLQAESLAPE